jgi:hypothetical protein
MSRLLTPRPLLLLISTLPLVTTLSTAVTSTLSVGLLSVQTVCFHSAPNSVIVASADTIDVKLNVGGSVVPADGVIRVVAYMSDLAEIPGPAEVGRDFA